MHARGDARHHPAALRKPSHVGHLPTPGPYLFLTDFRGMHCELMLYNRSPSNLHWLLLLWPSLQPALLAQRLS